MFEKNISSLTLWQFELLSKYPEIIHYVSGRAGGTSTGEQGSLNLSYKVGDASENVEANRKLLSQALGISASHLVFPVQTHSNHVALVETEFQELDDTDAVITNVRGICISVMSADCVPILLFDKDKKAVAAVHAGWKGTVAKILSHTIEAMKYHFSTNPESIVACIGPSICQKVYEVGPEVIEAVKNAFGSTEGLVSKVNSEGKGHLNLWEANKVQLIQAGVNPRQIEVAGVCTYDNSDQFFSARKSKNKAGRFAAGIMLR